MPHPKLSSRSAARGSRPRCGRRAGAVGGVGLPHNASGKLTPVLLRRLSSGIFVSVGRRGRTRRPAGIVALCIVIIGSRLRPDERRVALRNRD
ncbi:hypothetical protein EVAR_32551_1 [Eumeta japonica]|uniref:Uncharacterized protein n=1 Tax=Eumeta variegata TaxID=151549 RepID=A0A4C1VPQ2_EUMVA|nr:hypothetical protein EVAR_32551_1 [Eumeta japonica]